MKRNKLFGIFNIVDILLILIVIIVGIVGGRMLLGGRGAAESGADTKTYSYVVMGEEVVAETANFPVVGGNAYESSTSTYLGTVKDVKQSRLRKRCSTALRGNMKRCLWTATAIFM